MKIGLVGSFVVFFTFAAAPPGWAQGDGANATGIVEGCDVDAHGPSGARATAYVEPANANREDNIWVFDGRAEQTVNFTVRIRTRLFS